MEAASVIVKHRTKKNNLHDVDLRSSKLLIIHFLIPPDIFGRLPQTILGCRAHVFHQDPIISFLPPQIIEYDVFFPPSLPSVQVPSVSLSRTHLSVQRVPVPVSLNNANLVRPQ